MPKKQRNCNNTVIKSECHTSLQTYLGISGARHYQVSTHSDANVNAVYWEIRNTTRRHHCEMSFTKINPWGRLFSTIFSKINPFSQETNANLRTH